jgi:hypothetical protein
MATSKSFNFQPISQVGRRPHIEGSETMSARPPLALVVTFVAFAAALYAPAFGSDPTPAPLPLSSPVTQGSVQSSPGTTLQPLSLDATPDPASTGGPYPRLLGHIVASAACLRFVDHYNVAAAVITANDQRIGVIDSTLNELAADYYRRDGALKAYDHRLRLIDNVSQMLKTIPVEQGAVNELLAQAKETKNPSRQAALQESASALQKSVDRQRSLAYDLSNVAHVLMDKHGYEDTFSGTISHVLPPGVSFNLNPGDAPVPQPGDGPLLDRSAPPKNQTTVQDVLQYNRQTSIIASAETRASTAALRVVTTCVQESNGPSGDQARPAQSPTP